MNPVLRFLRDRLGEQAGTHLFLLCCIATVVSFFTWATVGELDVVSLATGEVVPASQVKSIQHLEGGIVREILVHEGERVERNQPLIRLESTNIAADVAELKVRMRALEITIHRLNAEITATAEIPFPTELTEAEPELVSEAIALFNTRNNRLRSQIDGQVQLVSQRQLEINEVKVRLKNANRSIQLLEEQIEIIAKQMELGLSNRMTHLNLLREEADLKGRRDEDKAFLPRAMAALNAANAQLTAIKEGFEEEARKELSDARRTERELSERLRKFEDSLRRTVLRAPVDGIVKTLYIVTQGGVIQPGATVIDIVPGDDRLVVEARLPPQDIGYIRMGQTAQLQLASAEAARYGTIEGIVDAVSPDTIISQEGQAFYKVRISPEQDFFQRGELEYRLYPGMQIQSSIMTGTRTVMDYLLEPYLGSASLALRER